MEKVMREGGVWSKARGWPEKGEKKEKKKSHFLLWSERCVEYPPVLLYSTIHTWLGFYFSFWSARVLKAGL